MPYELTVAARPNPSDRQSRAPRQTPKLSNLVLTGTLDDHATEAVMALIAQTVVEGADSVLVELHDVVPADSDAFDAFSRRIMALRARGTEVQIFAREDALYERLHGMQDARDWLLWRVSDGLDLPRRSLHIDGRVEAAPKPE